MNLCKGSEGYNFLILTGFIEKYKPALSKSDCSWDKLYCVNMGKLLFLVSGDNFFC